MPEMRFTIRWPDGETESCYSPSLVIKDHLEPGRSYPMPEFLDRSRTALTVASDRVKAKYGFPCARALGQIRRIEAACRLFQDTTGAEVGVLFFQE